MLKINPINDIRDMGYIFRAENDADILDKLKCDKSSWIQSLVKHFNNKDVLRIWYAYDDETDETVGYVVAFISIVPPFSNGVDIAYVYYRSVDILCALVSEVIDFKGKIGAGEVRIESIYGEMALVDAGFHEKYKVLGC